MKFKKMISSNKLCTCLVLSAAGAFMGMVAAKALIKNCGCCEKLKCKAKKAIKTIEQSL